MALPLQQTRQKPNKQSHVKSKTLHNHKTQPGKTHFDNGLCCKSNRFKYRGINGEIARNDTQRRSTKSGWVVKVECNAEIFGRKT